MHLTQRFELFFFLKIWSKNFFSVWFTELNLFYHYEKNGTFEWNKTWLKRIEPSFWHDSKDWTFFLTWLKELNFFQKKYSKNWTFWNMRKNWTFLNYDSKIWTFLFDPKNWTFCLIWAKEMNFCEYDSKHWQKMTQRIEPSRSKYDSKDWTFSSQNDSTN